MIIMFVMKIKSVKMNYSDKKRKEFVNKKKQINKKKLEDSKKTKGKQEALFNENNK